MTTNSGLEHPPLLSVVTITYQDPENLSKTIQSLKPLQQSGLSWEHVVIDSSFDLNTPVLQNVSHDWPLKRVKSPAEGIYKAFNQGILSATGKYIWFLNSGDELVSVEALQKTLSLFQSPLSPDAVLASADLMRDREFLHTQVHSPHFLRNLLGTNRICHQSLIYGQSVFNDVGLFSTEFQLASDYEHYYRIYLAGKKIASTTVSLVRYDMSGSSSRFEAVFREFRKVQKTLAPKLPFWINTLNALTLPLEIQRVRVFKFLRKTPLKRALEPLWRSWKRL